MHSFFTSLGRFSVRFRFLIVIAWIIVPILAVKTLPSLSDVAQDTTSGFLPASAPSMQAAALAAPFQNASLASATLVAARNGTLTADDNAAIDKLEAQIRTVPHVKIVLDIGISGDGMARQALVEADVVTFSGGPEAQGVVERHPGPVRPARHAGRTPGSPDRPAGHAGRLDRRRPANPRPTPSGSPSCSSSFCSCLRSGPSWPPSSP